MLTYGTYYRISGDLNWTLAFIIPIGVTLVIGLIRRSAMEVHHSVLALYSGRSAIQFLSGHATYSYVLTRGLCAVITEALKNRVGRHPSAYLSLHLQSD